jgi:hypothetical protein
LDGPVFVRQCKGLPPDPAIFAFNPHHFVCPADVRKRHLRSYLHMMKKYPKNVTAILLDLARRTRREIQNYAIHSNESAIENSVPFRIL